MEPVSSPDPAQPADNGQQSSQDAVRPKAQPGHVQSSLPTSQPAGDAATPASYLAASPADTNKPHHVVQPLTPAEPDPSGGLDPKDDADIADMLGVPAGNGSGTSANPDPDADTPADAVAPFSSLAGGGGGVLAPQHLAGASSPHHQRGPHKKVLLVEDDDGLAQVYLTRLDTEGIEVKRVPNGEDALATAVKYKPDLIVLDAMMPKVNGFDVLDILRHTPETMNVKVIMLTALSQEADRERARDLGVDDYLVKSQVVIADVVQRIRQHLGLV